MLLLLSLITYGLPIDIIIIIIIIIYYVSMFFCQAHPFRLYTDYAVTQKDVSRNVIGD
jgi:hypothetical protein